MRHGPGTKGMPLERAKNFRGTVRRLMEYLRPHGGFDSRVRSRSAQYVVQHCLAPHSR